MKNGKVFLLGILILVLLGCTLGQADISLSAVEAKSSSITGDFVIQVDITNAGDIEPTKTASASVEIYGLSGSESGNEIEWDVIAVTTVPDVIDPSEVISYQMAGSTVTYTPISYTVTVTYTSATVESTSTSLDGDFTVD